LSLEEFNDIEHDVFARLRELRGGHTAPISMTSGDGSVSVEASVSDDVICRHVMPSTNATYVYCIVSSDSHSRRRACRPDRPALGKCALEVRPAICRDQRRPRSLRRAVAGQPPL
jgi:hypothetical protein